MPTCTAPSPTEPDPRWGATAACCSCITRGSAPCAATASSASRRSFSRPGMVPGERQHEPTIRINRRPDSSWRRAAMKNGDRGRQPTFENVPSFVYRSEHRGRAWPASVRRIFCDIAFGGAYYAFCDATDLGLSLEPVTARPSDRSRQAGQAGGPGTNVHRSPDRPSTWVSSTASSSPARRPTRVTTAGTSASSPRARSTARRRHGGQRPGRPAARCRPAGGRRDHPIESILGTCFAVPLSRARRRSLTGRRARGHGRRPT